MSSKQPIQGPGRFQWNREEWFGARIGFTAWLLPTGLIFAYRNPILRTPLFGLFWLVIFVAINALGFWMWSRRDRIGPYRAIQVLWAASGVGGLIALGSIYLLGRPTVEIHGLRFVLDSGQSKL